MISQLEWNVQLRILQFRANHQLHMGNDKQSRRQNSIPYRAGTVGVGIKVEGRDRLACFHNSIEDKFLRRHQLASDSALIKLEIGVAVLFR